MNFRMIQAEIKSFEGSAIERIKENCKYVLCCLFIQFLACTHVTQILTTVANRHVGVQLIHTSSRVYCIVFEVNLHFYGF